MVRLTKDDLYAEDRQSSKGNQLKWKKDGLWYKADYTGYEGLAEYIVSLFLGYSDLKPEEYVTYQTEKIEYQRAEYTGCVSKDFLPKGYKMITLERLYHNETGRSLLKTVYQFEGITDRLKYLTEQIVRLTNLEDFGSYLCKLLTIDAFFLNEDRHFHNIAVLVDDAGRYQLCPIFDQGGALLSDTTMDYPLGKADTLEYMQQVRSKTLCRDFDEQLDVAERLFGQQIRFSFGGKEIEEALRREPYYPEEIKSRVETILRQQRRKYAYLFT
jgi:hypothetical protein